jgi:hypothetical protein
MRWSDDPEAWVRQEFRDLLDFGPVGIDEVVWLLRGGFPELPEDQRLTIATNAVNDALADGGLVLRILRWPSMTVVKDVERRLVEAVDFVEDLGMEFMAVTDIHSDR